LRNDGNQNNFLLIGLQGLNDNKSAIGAKVSFRRYALAKNGDQRFRLSSPEFNDLVAGLGKERTVDTRMLWPTVCAG